MNLRLLPKELQDLIGEFNVEHRFNMRVVLNKMLEKYENSIITNSLCENCGDCADENSTVYIHWRKSPFCGEWCLNDAMISMRKRRMKN